MAGMNNQNAQLPQGDCQGLNLPFPGTDNIENTDHHAHGRAKALTAISDV